MSGRSLVRRARSSSGFARLGAVGVVAAVTAAVLVGHGYAKQLVHLDSGGAWLSASHSGEVVHVNGASGDVDARAGVAKLTHGRYRVAAQNSKLAWVTDTAGRAFAVDLSSLDPTEASADPGVGTQLFLGDSQAYVVDLSRGRVQLVNASSLSPIGEPLKLHTRVLAAADGSGALYVMVPSTGELLRVSDGEVVARHHLAAKGAAVSVSVIGDRPVVLATGRSGAVVLQPGREPVPVPGPGDVDDLTLQAPLTAAGSADRAVVVNSETGTLLSVALHPGGDSMTAPLHHRSDDYGAPVVQGSFAYVPDETTGSVLQVSLASGQVESHKVGAPGSELEVFSQGDFVYLNAAGALTAYVVDAAGTLTKIVKNAPDVPGAPTPPTTAPTEATLPPPVTEPTEGSEGPTTPTTPGDTGPGTTTPPATTPPTTAPPASASPTTTTQPPAPVTKPGAPPTVTASAGNAEATVAWGAPDEGNGEVSEVTVSVYRVKGASGTASGEPERTIEVPIPADATSAAGSTTVKDLTNGRWYVFTVAATNQAGEGPATASAPAVRPQSGIPDQVSSVKATYRGNGRIAVSWPLPDANGVTITGYVVTGEPSSGKAIKATISDPSTRSATFTPDDGVVRGGRYRFTVALRYTDASGAATVGPAGAASDRVVAEVAPSARPSLRASGSGTRITVKVRDSEAHWDGPDACTLYVDGKKAGRISDCSGSKSFTYACGSSHTYWVVPANAIGTGPRSAKDTAKTKDCPPPPKPSVSLSKGRPYTGHSSCTDPSCAYIIVKLSNFSSGSHHVVCSGTHEGDFYSYDTTGNGTSERCAYGWQGGTVTVTVDGKYKGTMTWPRVN